MDFAWQFLYNMKMPFTAIWILTLLACALVVEPSRKIMRASNAADYKYGVAEWRLWTAANVAVVTSLVWMLIMSVPAPDFRTTIVEKPVFKIVEKPVDRWHSTRLVYKTPSYMEVNERCLEASGDESAIKTSRCHQIATEAALPISRVKNVTVWKHDPYQELYDNCMDPWIGGSVPADKLAEMVRLCHDQSMVASGRRRWTK